MRQQLEKDGYKDVRITPEAFVVHAKDPQGDPVVMMITPDQVTSIVEESGSSTAPAGSASSASKNKAGSGK